MIALGTRPTIIRNVRIPGPTAAFLPFSDVADVVLRDGLIADIALPGALRTTGVTWDAEGRWMIPGLWDHHVHLGAWALRTTRVDLSRADSAREAAALMAAARPDSEGVRIGVDYRDVLWADAPADVDLDQVCGDVPTYLLNADLHSVWMNSAACARSGVAPTADGVHREHAAFDIHAALDRLPPRIADAAVYDAADNAASRGVVGIADYDMAGRFDDWRRRGETDFDALRVSVGSYLDQFTLAAREGVTTGDAFDAQGLLRVGPLKIITDGSLGTGTAACSHAYTAAGGRGTLNVAPADLTQALVTAAQAGWEVAVHAIGDVAVSHALDAFAASGATGSIEHAQLVAASDLARFGRLDVTASLQPAHALDDRDVVDRDWGTQTAMAYPMRALVDAGANVVFGSDAPVAALDPWATIADAVGRMRPGTDRWRAEESIDVSTALDASTGVGTAHDSLLVPGAVADVAFCDADPYASDVEGLRGMRVGATLIAGRFTHIG